ncbi:hypothetical protein [uncultured Acidaminococcus sp.]|uniref:hypothetical protein n=1 Tax=uncultured Acidaminococcus sp. TaxID=352152 RepID=UPI0026108839|nr:hypothetical protein [uncultured Acidaminococcus sp.]
MKKTLKTLCMTIFEITMPLFMLVGIALVLIQTVAIFSGNGSLLVWIRKTLYPWASNASSVCMFAAFIFSYVKHAE